MPAARYALRAGPRTPGACPSTWSVRPVVSLATSASSPAITPGKFIISATPIVRWRRRRLSMSPVVNGRRGDSKRDAGTQEDAMTYTSRGRSVQQSRSQWMPSVPSTLAISCGSATTAVVPCASTARANSSTISLEDSMCMWASIKPGTRKAPETSRRSRPPSYRPSPTTWPSLMATSTSSHSLVNTESTLPPASTRSAGSSPRATAIQCASMRVKDSASAAGGQSRAHEDEHEADAHPGREALVQHQDSGHRRHRGVDVRDHSCPHGPDLGDEGEEEQERQRRADEGEHADRGEHAGGRNGSRPLKSRHRRIHDGADRQRCRDHADRRQTG